MLTNNKGNLYIVAAPSGAGKTSLVKNLVENLDDIVVSISHTTRPKRQGETDKIDYFFIDKLEFSKMVDAGDFVEHAEVYGYEYGTSKQQLNHRLQNGIDVVLDIDWQGAAQIKQAYPDAIGVFIVPPTLDSLKERLIGRRQDSEKTISSRMQSAQNELAHYNEFDYLIVNEDFQRAGAELIAIVVANRLQIKAQTAKLDKLLSFLLAKG